MGAGEDGERGEDDAHPDDGLGQLECFVATFLALAVVLDAVEALGLGLLGGAVGGGNVVLERRGPLARLRIAGTRGGGPVASPG